MKATIYHNPRCGTSRNVLGLLRERGIVTDRGARLCRPSETVRELLP